MRDLVAVGVEDLDTRIARQQFPLGVVASSLALVLRTGTRLRRVPGVLALSWNWCDVDARQASSYSVRLRLLRLGLYHLNRPQQQADDWMWIVDHTLQMGNRKCLIVVGIRQSAWDAKARVLSHEDVNLIDLQAWKRRVFGELLEDADPGRLCVQSTSPPGNGSDHGDVGME